MSTPAPPLRPLAVDARLARLATLELPPGAGLARDHVVPPEMRGPDFDARYDFRTLVYDAFHLPARRALALICPPLLNLARVLREGEITLDGRPASIRRIRRNRRFDLVELPCDRPPARLAIAFGGWRVETAIPDRQAAAFAGRNCLMTLSRDNRLRWIRDWVGYHVREHGADAALFYDNGSTAYTPEALLAEIAAVEGIEVARVVPAPLPYGPIPVGGSRSRPLFLQTALWNDARLRFLAEARAVLACDVDELVVGRDGGRIFDATVASRAGFVSFRGTWRAHGLGADAEPAHRDHDRMPAKPADCPRKYCIVPGGPLRRHAWNTHALVWLPFSRWFESRDFRYLHCRGITTRWKSAHSRQADAPGPVDPATAEILGRAFPQPD